MKVQTSVLLSENLLAAIEQLSEKDKTLSDIIEADLQSYLTKLERFEEADNDFEIRNKNADYINQETQDALQYQAEL